MVSSKLIVGNAILKAVESGEQKLDIDYFINYQKKLKEHLETKVDRMPNITADDILDTAHSMSPYLKFEEPVVGYSCFRTISIIKEESTVEKLKEKLSIYYKDITPEWLLSAIDSI